MKDRSSGPIGLDPDLPDYFRKHPSVISRFNGDEASLTEDPSITGGWKIRHDSNKSGKPRKRFVTPDRKYVIRTIEGVLEYLQHNDVQDDNIESLFETLLSMKNSQLKVNIPSDFGEKSLNNPNIMLKDAKGIKSEAQTEEILESRKRTEQKTHETGKRTQENVVD